jgi:hypothetical protein
MFETLMNDRDIIAISVAIGLMLVLLLVLLSKSRTSNWIHISEHHLLNDGTLVAVRLFDLVTGECYYDIGYYNICDKTGYHMFSLLNLSQIVGYENDFTDHKANRQIAEFIILPEDVPTTR